jgi:CHAT domain-containing protein
MRPEELVVRLEKKWQEDYESYFDRPLQKQPFRPFQDIQQSLKTLAEQTGKRTALLYVMATPQYLEYILVTPDLKPVFKINRDATRTRLREVAQQLRFTVSDPRLLNSSEYLKPAQQIYQWLIQPLELFLQSQKIDTLVFCTGAGLRSLPFPALHDGQQFLIEKFSLGLIPSYNLTTAQYSDLRHTPVLATGASLFPRLSPLPAVPLELASIVKTQGGKVLLNQQFTVKNLKVERQQTPFKIVHLATHGQFRPGSVDKSFIQMWNSRLHLDEIGQLNLQDPPVDLLVLSACTTALGNAQAELGFAGLAVQAGVQSALGSLWYISDAGTLALMTEFYRQLLLAPTRSEALRQAQLKMLSGTLQFKSGQLVRSGTETNLQLPTQLATPTTLNLSHPYYWAAFAMIGSPW